MTKTNNYSDQDAAPANRDPQWNNDDMEAAVKDRAAEVVEKASSTDKSSQQTTEDTSDERTETSFAPDNDILPLPALTRYQPPPSLPGAYAQGGRPDFVRPTRTVAPTTTLSSTGDTSHPQDPVPFEDNSESLATAVPVLDEEQPELPRAQEWPTPETKVEPKEEKGFTTNRWKQAVHGFGVLLAVLAGTLLVLHLKGSLHEHKENDSLSGHGQDIGPNEYLVSLLPNETINALEDPESAQAIAFDWMIGDPNLKALPAWRVVQRYALATFYYATTCEDGWNRQDNWMSYESHECDWYHSDFEEVTDGVYDPSELANSICGGATQEEYHYLLIITNGLKGILPPELLLLTNLKAVSLRGNHLQGQISSDIADLRSLWVLDLSANEFTGTVPSEIGSLTELNGLFLFYNEITGSIPLEITGLSSLVHLVIDGNQLTGPLPSQIGSMERLENIILCNNRLSGTIPSELGNAPLKRVILNNNDLTGSIPTEIGKLTDTADLLLGDIKTSGTLPTEIGQLTSLQLLTLYNSGLIGTIPTEVGLLTNAKGLLFSNNDMTGTLPKQVENLSNIMGILLDGNNMSGTIPTELVQHQSLVALRLDHNVLTGPIPSQLGLLPKLEFLDLSSNGLVGTVPQELGLATSILELRLDHNQLTGTLPPTLSQLFGSSFSVLSMLEGRILQPLKSASLPSKALSLGFNKFTGTLPSEFGLLRQLSNLSVPDNSLTGSLPSELGRMKWLSEMYINNNNFSGTVPSELGVLTRLTTLQAMANSLMSGSVPSEVCALEAAAHAFGCSELLCACDCDC